MERRSGTKLLVFRRGTDRTFGLWARGKKPLHFLEKTGILCAYLDLHLAHAYMSKVTPVCAWVTGHCPNPSVCMQTCPGRPGKPNGGAWREHVPLRVAELGTRGPAGGVASTPGPRLLARCQASPASPPCYKRRDRGAPASLRQQPVGRAGFRRVPVRLPAAASVTPLSGAVGRRREPWELQPSRSRQV